MSNITFSRMYFSTLQCEKCEQFYDLFAQSEAELRDKESAFLCECTPEEAEAGRRRCAEKVERLREMLGW